MEFRNTKRAVVTFLLLWWCAFDAGLVADTYVVTHTGDSGAASLHEAVVRANSRSGADTVAFNILMDDPGFNGDVWKIELSCACEMIDDSTCIDGYSQTQFSGDTNLEGPEIEISFFGTLFAVNSSHGTIRGLILNGFETTAVRIRGGGFNRVCENYIGTDFRGLTSACQGLGIHISKGAHDNRVFSNLISGTVPAGVYMEGDNVERNSIQGNTIGTDKDGSKVIGGGNKGHGIFVLSNLLTFQGPEENTIVGNTIAGFQWGVYLAGAGTDNNVVEGNYIGITAGGILLGNRDAGVHLCDGPKHNRVIDNIVAGVSGGSAFNSGVNINGSQTWDNLIEANTVISNYYGISLSGWAGGVHEDTCLNEHCVNCLSRNIIRNNESHGVYVASMNSSNRIWENTIADNEGDGIHIAGTNNGIIVTRNSIFNNGGFGIWSSIPAPQFQTYQDYAVHGTARPYAIIELFSDSFNQGARFLGETEADASGSFHFDISHSQTSGVVTATATHGEAGTSGFSSPLTIPLSITSSMLAEGWKGIAYGDTLSAIGGKPPYVWALVTGSLPSGLLLNSEGIISGTPGEADTAEFAVELSDDAGATDIRTLTLAVHPCPKGDVNGDGEVDIADVLRVINIILRVGGSPTAHEICAADGNGDGRIDILDVVGIVNMILGAGRYTQ
ncbi:MAG: right-handed parallel beta-helix repeat-containing protein [Gemmatimonadota bacterium]|nr:MAG: right-handed parallel beta-helix repeat-containing protein [Gemmatimonadota bacterium]